MKKVINGKLYDTNTAHCIASDSSYALGMSDFRYYDESLYVTKTKNFFLAGEGHAMTKWGRSNGNTTGWGNGIIPITAEDALEWCENANICAETIAEYFTLTEA